MKNSTPRLFSPTQHAINTNERIGNTTPRSAIDRNHHFLFNNFFEPLFALDEYIKLLEDIRAVTSDPALQGKLMTTWEHEVYKRSEDTKGLDEEINVLLVHVRHACLYLELARAADDNKDRDRAWAFTNEASLMIDWIGGSSGPIFDKIDVANRVKQNRENGKGRNKAHLPVKEAAIRLLDEMKPEGGWPTKTKAVKAIETHLAEVIEKEQILTLDISNVEKWLTTWLRDDELVKPAWELNKHGDAR
ncbi:hypothetical protein [Pseudomonas sp. GM21]|uniref:hypothetical protein n=1 Tax=Pseudomonas sp. GM21 TaxID=1144325 RepID=UPI000518F4DE|nr:hypothetical protein [Pseudomonas sp. GM21]